MSLEFHDFEHPHPESGAVPQVDHSAPVPISSIYFVFSRGHTDASQPMKVVLPKGNPTVFDFCETLKMIFFPGHHIVLSASFADTDYNESSGVSIPSDNRQAPVLVKAQFQANSSKLHAGTLKVIAWLEHNDLDYPEVLSIFTSNRVTLSNMKYLKDSDLLNMGIKEWGTRLNILTAIQRTHAVLTSSSVDDGHAGTLKRRAPSDSESSLQPSSKKLRLAPLLPPLASVKYKDVASLVNHPIVPVVVGSRLTVKDSDIYGTVVIGTKNKKTPVVEWIHEGKKRNGTIAHFFKSASSKASFSAKGNDWSQIFFSHPSTGTETYSLQKIKFLLEGPKKSISAFLYFSANIRDQVGGKGGGAFAKKSGEMWRSLPDSEKAKYQQKEEQDRTRYFRQKTEWQTQHNNLRQTMGIPEQDS